MTPEKRRLFLIGLAAVILVLFAAGVVSAFRNGDSSICPGGKSPVAEDRDEGLGLTRYRCPGGLVVTTR